MVPTVSPLGANSVAWFEAQLAVLPRDAPVDRDALLEQNLVFCLARARWADVVHFYSTILGSAEERQALQTLAPHLPACVPAGLSMEIRAPVLREILAEGLYHILTGPVPSDGR
jgi:hypothetical protein